MKTPTARFITTHSGKVIINGKWVLEQIILLTEEKNMRCGDGSIGKITSHSINCNCKEINKKLKEFQVMKNWRQGNEK